MGGGYQYYTELRSGKMWANDDDDDSIDKAKRKENETEYTQTRKRTREGRDLH
jgi:hypothetical protein